MKVISPWLSFSLIETQVFLFVFLQSIVLASDVALLTFRKQLLSLILRNLTLPLLNCSKRNSWFLFLTEMFFPKL